MYFPYLRGKQFELEALLSLPVRVYQKTVPILEPINLSHRKLYTRLANQNTPLILVTNPYHPQNNRLDTITIQNLINKELASHKELVLGFLIDQRFELSDLLLFLTTNANREKALIFRFNPMPQDMIAIQNSITGYTFRCLIFDDIKTSSRTQNTFIGSQTCVLLTDGFQRQDRNLDYPLKSAFNSNYHTWKADGWAGIGDYVTIGDSFKEGGGQAYVISLHVTEYTPTGLTVHHFSSNIHTGSPGLAAQKFAQANSLLVSSPQVSPLVSNGLDLFRDWDHRKHNPQLGAAKQASIMHHIELMSKIV